MEDKFYKKFYGIKKFKSVMSVNRNATALSYNAKLTEAYYESFIEKI